MRISDWSSDVCASELGEQVGKGKCWVVRHRPVPRRGRARAFLSPAAAPRAEGPALPLSGIGCGVGHHRRWTRRWAITSQDPPRVRVPARVDVVEGGLQGIERLVERVGTGRRSEEHTSELQSLMRSSYAIFCWTNT